MLLQKVLHLHDLFSSLVFHLRRQGNKWKRLTTPRYYDGSHITPCIGFHGSRGPLGNGLVSKGSLPGTTRTNFYERCHVNFKWFVRMLPFGYPNSTVITILSLQIFVYKTAIQSFNSIHLDMASLILVFSKYKKGSELECVKGVEKYYEQQILKNCKT